MSFDQDAAVLPCTLDGAFEGVKRLVDDFSASESFYLSNKYNEAEVRKDFIDKFLTHLGWDVNHEVQRNPFRQEVKVERAVHMATAQRRADYSLAVAPHFDSPVVYVEAKKPAKDIANSDNYFQTIRYGNQRGHPIGILTDFEQLHVVDCRFRPKIDTALQAGRAKYHYTDYAKPIKFAEIFYLLSRPAVADGSIQEYAKTLPTPKGRLGQKALFPLAYKPFDDRLLATLDDLRQLLARSLKNKNSSLDSAALTEITQRILDRLVFIRYVAFKSHHTGRAGGLFRKAYHFFSFSRDTFLAHYHKRSNVESTVMMIKTKFGDAVRSKTDVAMKNEVLCKVLCHNLCCLISAFYELGIKAAFGDAPTSGVQ